MIKPNDFPKADFQHYENFGRNYRNAGHAGNRLSGNCRIRNKNSDVLKYYLVYYENLSHYYLNTIIHIHFVVLTCELTRYKFIFLNYST
jgi:hypothetical protein